MASQYIPTPSIPLLSSGLSCFQPAPCATFLVGLGGGAPDPTYNTGRSPRALLYGRPSGHFLLQKSTLRPLLYRKHRDRFIKIMLRTRVSRNHSCSSSNHGRLDPYGGLFDQQNSFLASVYSEMAPYSRYPLICNSLIIR